MPANSIAGAGTLGLSESCAAPAGIPSDTVAAICVFTLAGATLSAAQPMTIRYRASALGGLPAARLSVYKQDADGSWSFVPTAVNAAAGTVSAYVSGPATLAVLADTQPFPDVPPSFWAAGDINTIVAASLADGFPDGTFRPNAALIRAQFTKMLVLALGLPVGSGTTGFTDVPADAWFAPYVAAGVRAGLIRGVSATTFDPDGTLTREEMAVLLARALHLTGTVALNFSDASSINTGAVGDVEAAVAAGYLVGFPNGTFQPLGPTTRAQAAQVLSTMIGHEAP